MTGRACLGEAALQGGRAFLVAFAFDLALLQMADRGERAGGQRRRQRRREDETRRVAPQEIDECGRARDIPANRAESFAEGALDHGRPVHDAVALGDAATAWAVEADGVHFVEIGHHPEPIGDVAHFADRRNVAIIE
jgi:hypothetical protein